MKKFLVKDKNHYIYILFLILFTSLLSVYSLELFHISVGIYSIVICFIIFIIILNTHQIISNSYYIFLGLSFAYIAIFEILHALTWQELMFLPYISGLDSESVWLCGRFTHALIILISFYFVGRKIKVYRVLIGLSIYSISLFTFLIHFNINFLDYLPSLNMFGFVFNNNYIVIVILLFSIIYFDKIKILFSKFHYNNMISSIIFFIISELFFILPTELNIYSNVFGHITRLLSFYFIYRSVVLTGLKEPYNTIFYKLTQSNKKLNDLNQILNIVKNIHETINANYELDILFDKIVNDLIKKEDYQMAFIGKYDNDKGNIEIKSGVGISNDFIEKKKLNINKDINAITQAIDKRKIVKDSNPYSISNIFYKKDHNLHNSLIALPICYENNIYGVLAITSYQNDAFNNKIVDLLNKITQNLGIAITRYLNTQEIIYISFHDQLTGLYNKNFFNEEMKRLDTKRKLPISVVISDFNDLKKINDNYGHNTGDKFLKAYADILKKNSRQEDIIARWGGDEFVILLPNTGEEKTKNLIDRIKSEIEKIEIANEKLSIAFGYAVKESNEQDIDEVFKIADQRMYKNKKLMKN
ncbi:MAG: diguanylate cyclase [Halanaerobiales bacterium]|nr:diguanylate cyclase [Halanaerobiales bacterium]